MKTEKIVQLRSEYFTAKATVDRVLNTIKSSGNNAEKHDYCWLSDPTFQEAIRKMNSMKRIATKNNVPL